MDFLGVFIYFFRGDLHQENPRRAMRGLALPVRCCLPEAPIPAWLLYQPGSSCFPFIIVPRNGNGKCRGRL